MSVVKEIACVSPIDGSVFASRTTLSREEAEHLLVKAKDAQRAWASLDLDARTSLVMQGVETLGTMTDALTTELAWQMGRPVKYGGEFSGVWERASYMASVATEALQDVVIEESDQFLRKIRRFPSGIVFVIAPWNYPFLTAINTIVPALISGNSVVLKHSSQTLLAGQRFEEAFLRAGLPEGVFQNVYLSHELTEELIQANSFDFINFTGSVSGGRVIEQAAAGTFTGIGLELGGKDPAYVMDDADIDSAVDTLIDGAMFNSGQCCCGIERIYVCESLYSSFVEKAEAIVSQYVLGNPLDESVTLGPMANIRFADLVRKQTQEAIAQGATPIVDPSLFAEDNGGTYLAPQLLTNVTHSMSIMREETFGPVVGIMKVKNDQDAIKLMNDSPFGLTASLWTQDIDRASQIAEQINTGTVYMNRCDYLDPALCWTGCKDTGRGIGLSALGYHSVTRPRSYHFRKNTQ